MALANAAPVNQRALLDTNYIRTVALPNAANTVTTNQMDLIQAVPYPVTDKVVLQLNTEQSTGANSKNINVVIQDSADNSSWANIATLAVKVIAGNAANYPSSSTNYSLPIHTRRYIRASATGEANGGDASDGDLTLQLLF